MKMLVVESVWKRVSRYASECRMRVNAINTPANQVLVSALIDEMNSVLQSRFGSFERPFQSVEGSIQGIRDMQATQPPEEPFVIDADPALGSAPDGYWPNPVIKPSRPTHPAEVNEVLALAFHRCGKLIDDAKRRGDQAGANAWLVARNAIEAAEKSMAEARRLQTWKTVAGERVGMARVCPNPKCKAEGYPPCSYCGEP